MGFIIEALLLLKLKKNSYKEIGLHFWNNASTMATSVSQEPDLL